MTGLLYLSVFSRRHELMTQVLVPRVPQTSLFRPCASQLRMNTVVMGCCGSQMPTGKEKEVKCLSEGAWRIGFPLIQIRKHKRSRW
ncbi:hypothetical protein NDU88_000795 [Pleurodeles waltl]|uniref:Uncharacterized protein n=1 Tax=Pleurodeles waltl TaxID=8319 RepID=A0AAV7SB32_PLEWA|nr:hypothetical protein NDU88_000795 [Pleurodeles waltl]